MRYNYLLSPDKEGEKRAFVVQVSDTHFHNLQRWNYFAHETPDDQEIAYPINSHDPMSDQDRISPPNGSTISTGHASD